MRGKIRIIGGRWRRRLIEVPALPGVRPTPDAVRETLFNWLAADIEGSCCLDLFAGSGALGFEASSRGARQVVMVDRERRVVDALLRTRGALGDNSVTIVHRDARQYLRQKPLTPGFDIVFLDPPFRQDSLGELLLCLVDAGWLNAPALIYTEGPSGQSDITPPRGVHLVREGHSGDSIFRLYRFNSE